MNIHEFCPASADPPSFSPAKHGEQEGSASRMNFYQQSVKSKAEYLARLATSGLELSAFGCLEVVAGRSQTSAGNRTKEACVRACVSDCVCSSCVDAEIG